MFTEKYAAADINAMKNHERNEGVKAGGNKMLYGLVSKGKLSVKDAAEEANVSEETFRKNMEACGFRIPR